MSEHNIHNIPMGFATRHVAVGESVTHLIPGDGSSIKPMCGIEMPNPEGPFLLYIPPLCPDCLEIAEQYAAASLTALLGEIDESA